MLTVLHTADWHLGHQLHGYLRHYEHQCFLDWLHQQVAEHQADALIVAGDLFENAAPPASAWQQLYQFMARLRADFPTLDLILLGGNHDSPSKLNAPHSLLRAFDLHLIGSIRDSVGEVDLERLLLPITDKSGEIAAWCVAMPFVRSADLPAQAGESADADRLTDGMREIYRQACEQAMQRKTDQQALIATCHHYLVGGEVSDLSERRVIGGNQHALPLSVFPSELDYVALGHLHKPQRVGQSEHIRYSGSPIPLSMAEKNYKHQVLKVQFQQGQLHQVDTLLVPRAVDMLAVPEKPAPLDQVLEALDALELPTREMHLQPFLEVRVALDRPQALLREKIRDALKDKPVRLARIAPTYLGASADQQAPAVRELDAITPKEVFELCYTRQFDHQVPTAMAEAFEQLLQQVEEQDA